MMGFRSLGPGAERRELSSGRVTPLRDGLGRPGMSWVMAFWLGAGWALGMGMARSASGATPPRTAVAPVDPAAIVRWTTNYYVVTGATVRELRRSLTDSRPWKRRVDADAITTWKVDWRFGTQQGGDGCRPSGVSTVVTIQTTLPRYVPPKDVPEEVVERWKDYFGSLARHEAQHAAFGLRAASEVRSRLGAHGPVGNCAELTRILNSVGAGVVEQVRREEREFDQRTRHGATDGARFP